MAGTSDWCLWVRAGVCWGGGGDGVLWDGALNLGVLC